MELIVAPLFGDEPEGRGRVYTREWAGWLARNGYVAITVKTPCTFCEQRVEAID